MNLMQRGQARWATLALREQRWLLLALTLLLLALLWWLALAPALAVRRGAPAQQLALDAQLQSMQRLQAQAKVLQTQPVVSAEAAQKAIQSALIPLGATARLSQQSDRSVVTFTGVRAEALAQWLANVRQNAHAVPAELHLQRNATLTWDGTLVLNLEARP
jgi:general secretion pathway protein M